MIKVDSDFLSIVTYSIELEGACIKMERFFLYDDVEDTKTRFVSFTGKTQRYDLAILQSSRFFGKVLVLDIQFGRFAIIGPDDVEEPGYLEHAYNRTEEEAADLREYLTELLG